MLTECVLPAPCFVLRLFLHACRQALQRLTEAAEKAKIELSALPQTSINLPFITATADGPKHIDTTLSRAQFEQLCNDLLERVRRPVEQVRGLGCLSCALDQCTHTHTPPAAS